MPEVPEYDDLRDEGPDEQDLRDLADDETTETLACPACGAEIYAGADRCPHCGNWVTLREGGCRRSGLWWLIVLAVIAAMLIAYGIF
jgi:predicted RNA-binding Zn-ribbon protein involved in translation (DUF1610 family)